MNLCLTALASFDVLFLAAKLIGHKQIAQFNFFDYTTGITVGFIAAEKEGIQTLSREPPYSRKPLMSLIRDRIMLQPQLTTPGSGSMTSRIRSSISSLEVATAWTWSLLFPVTR